MAELPLGDPVVSLHPLHEPAMSRCPVSGPVMQLHALHGPAMSHLYASEPEPGSPSNCSEREPMENYRDRIESIYREHNPGKLGEVDKLMEKYGSHSSVLYQAICRKYNIEPEAALLPEDASHDAPTMSLPPLHGPAMPHHSLGCPVMQLDALRGPAMSHLSLVMKRGGLILLMVQ